MVFLEPPPDIAIIAPPPKPPWLDYTYIYNGTHMLKVPDNGGETSAVTTELTTSHETTHTIRFADVSTSYATDNPQLTPSANPDTPEGATPPATNTIHPDSLPSLSPTITTASSPTSASGNDRITTNKLRVNDASTAFVTNTLPANSAFPPSVNSDSTDATSTPAEDIAPDLKTTKRLSFPASTASTTHAPSPVSSATSTSVPSVLSNLPDAASTSAAGTTGGHKTTPPKPNYPNTHASTTSAGTTLSPASSAFSASTAGIANTTDGLNKTTPTKLFNDTDMARRQSDTDGGHSMVATYVILAIVGTLVVVLLLLGLLLWYKKKHMIGNKVLPSERSSAFTHQTPPLHAALAAVISSTKTQRRRSSTSSGISLYQSDDSTKPFVTSSEHLTRPANAVYPPLAMTGFPTAPLQGRSRQTLSCAIAPSEPDELPDLVQLQRSPNKAALLPIERRPKPQDNAKRKTARKRRRKQQSAGTSPVDGASCLDTFTPLRVVTNPTSDTDVTESYA